MADSKLTALSALSVPALEDLAYIVDDPSGTATSYKVTQSRQGGLYVPGICDARLTLSSSLPVTTTDIGSVSTIYWLGYKGNRVALYDGTRWNLHAIGSGASFLLSSVATGNNYDLFLYDNAGTLTLEQSAAWSNATTRTDALTTQDNVYVKSGATTRRYLGTFRTTGSTTTEDSGGPGSSQVGGKRFLWNYYHRVPRSLAVVDTTNSWTYTTATWRVADGATAPLNCVEYVCGLGDDAVSASLLACCNWGNVSYAMVAVGIDNTTPQGVRSGIYQSTGNLIAGSMQGFYSGQPGQGYHTIRWLENGFGSPAGVTFEGDNNEADGRQSGLVAMVYA